MYGNRCHRPAGMEDAVWLQAAATHCEAVEEKVTTITKLDIVTAGVVSLVTDEDEVTVV